MQTRRALLEEIAMTLGGRAAEELVFNEVTTGAANDLEKITHTAKQMVMRWGMSEKLGPRVLGRQNDMPFLGREMGKAQDYSEATAVSIDAEVKRFVSAAYDTAKRLLTEHKATLLKIADELLREVRARGVEPVVYAVGKKGVGSFRFRGIAMRRQWQGFSEVPAYERAEEIGAALIDDFAAGEIDELVCAYTDFRSAFTLRATSKRFLPIAAAEVAGSGPKVVHPEYLFEPAPAEILDHLLPQYLVTKVYAALLESAASENESRRRAMKAATDNAEELIKILTRQANRARQDEITTEIMEIVGGAEALAAGFDLNSTSVTKVYAFPNTTGCTWAGLGELPGDESFSW